MQSATLPFKSGPDPYLPALLFVFVFLYNRGLAFWSEGNNWSFSGRLLIDTSLLMFPLGPPGFLCHPQLLLFFIGSTGSLRRL